MEPEEVIPPKKERSTLQVFQHPTAHINCVGMKDADETLGAAGGETFAVYRTGGPPARGGGGRRGRRRGRGRRLSGWEGAGTGTEAQRGGGAWKELPSPRGGPPSHMSHMTAAPVNKKDCHF